MIQDIYPSRLKNEYHNYDIRETDRLLVFDDDGKILLGEKEGVAVFLSGRDICADEAVYLFSLDETRFFLYIFCSCAFQFFFLLPIMHLFLIGCSYFCLK